MKVLIDRDGKKLFFDESAEFSEFHTHFGIIKKEKIVNAKNGEVLETHKGEKFVVLEPNFIDFFENIERGPAIILPKDAGVISANTGIASGSKVVEAGSGSGALTCYLANLVKPRGKVYSYEKRKEFLEIAKRNVNKMGLSKFVKFKNKSTHDTIEEKEIDVVILDMPDPWSSIKNAEAALKPGGFLVCYLPHIEQVKELLDATEKTSLRLQKVSDIVEYEANQKLNFSAKINHTAYLVLLRKLV